MILLVEESFAVANLRVVMDNVSAERVEAARDV
jgi:hypothetical protein